MNSMVLLVFAILAIACSQAGVITSPLIASAPLTTVTSGRSAIITPNAAIIGPSDTTTGIVSSPLVASPWASAPLVASPWAASPWAASPLVASPWAAAPLTTVW